MQRDFPLFLLNETEFNYICRKNQIKMENENEKTSENNWNKCQENVNGIKLSEETRKLLSCHAKLINLYGELTDIKGRFLDFDNPEEPDGLFDRFRKFEEKINEMISVSIEDNTVNSYFKEM